MDNPDEVLQRELAVGRLHDLLGEMEIPDERWTDLAWLRANLGPMRRFHPAYPEAAQIIKDIALDGVIVE